MESTARETVHEYLEVSGELLAKPNALAEVIEENRTSPVVVFCNAPSDADLLEALLRKRGITSRKLIGNVPPMKVSKAVSEVKSREALALIVTDVSGQSVNLNDFDISVNYAMHSDPEVYMQRSGQQGGGTPLRTISLIGPLDLTHFHYLKKVGGLEFVQLQPASPEKISSARVESLRKDAHAKKDSFDERTKAVVEYIMTDPEVRDLVGLLVVNTFEVIPSLSIAPTDRSEGDEEGRESRGGRDRGDRDRGERGGDHRGDRHDRGRDRNNRRERFDDGERAPRTPTPKEVRVYLGTGTAKGLTEEKLIALIEEKCPEAKDHIKRFSGRHNYAFFDVDESVAEVVTSKLADASHASEKLFVKEAIRIPVLREKQEVQETTESSEDTAADSEQQFEEASVDA